MLQRAANSFPTTTWWAGSRRRTISEDFYFFIRFLAILAILCTAIAFYVQSASEIKATQMEIRNLQEEYNRIQRENAEIIRQIGMYTDVDYIEKRARELGYQPPQSRMVVRMNVTTDAPEATVRAVPTPAAPERAPWWEVALNRITERLHPTVYAQARR